jgi:lipopolysaccharide/colanic/teichoic acid biosynthesis glycosyltransferase
MRLRQNAQPLHWLERAKSYARQGLCPHDRVSSVLILMKLSSEEGRKRSFELVKRLFDLVASAALLILLLPVFVMIGAVLAIDGGAILYSQPRLGRGMMPFWILKFRTLAADADTQMNASPLCKANAAGKSSRLGTFLRKYKLDELPQLINVFKGEMSLVGPRPLPIDESLVTHDKRILRFAVRPGMTGLWQAHRSNLISGRRRLALDFHYVKIRSWWVDFAILFRTVAVVLRGERELPRAVAGEIRKRMDHHSAGGSSRAA